MKKEISLPWFWVLISEVISCNISPVNLLIKTDSEYFSSLVKILSNIVLSFKIWVSKIAPLGIFVKKSDKPIILSSLNLVAFIFIFLSLFSLIWSAVNSV